jgi:hypothetical protein
MVAALRHCPLTISVLQCQHNRACVIREGIVRHETRGIQENSFRGLYSGFVNGIPIPTDEVQHARMRDSNRKKGTASPTSPTNEGEWTEVKNKVKKVRFMCQDRFGKNKTNG